MGKWTRRDLVKTALAASASMMAGGDLLAQPVLGDGHQQAGSNDAHASGEVLAADAAGNAANPLRDRLLMDFGWRFALGNADDPDKDFGFGKLRREGTYAKNGHAGGPADPKFDDSAWAAIDLPHDWALDLPFIDNSILVEHGGKPLGREYPATSIGWYRRSFHVPAADAGKRVCVEFDGIFRNAILFVNGNYIGVNFSGYAPFNADITDFLNYGDSDADGRNVLTVRVDATLDEGWFYEGAGIYRHVWLTKTAPAHIARYGNYVRSTVNGSSATVFVSTEVLNESDRPIQGRVHAKLIDSDGKTVATAASKTSEVPAGEGFIFQMQAPVSGAKLWSLEQRNLYRAVTVFEADGKAVDQDAATFGIRTLKFDANQGFLLNGRQVKIQGTCNHQDHAGVGEAIPDRVQAYRLELLRKMGCNAIRTSHNPPTPELLDACDRMGVMVMDETRMMSSSPEGLSQLERLVKRDRNHPSVIIWSLANEEPEQASAMGARIVASMKKLQRKLDPSRVCTTAMNGGWGGIGVSTVVDVQGCNYRTGLIDAYHKEHPAQPMIGTETASTLGTRGIYTDDPARGYEASYGLDKPKWGATPEEWWSFYADRPWLAGGFAWTGFDYRGEPTPYKWPCISSHFGIMDTCGFPKDYFYYYQSWWGTQPVLHLFPHWNWEGSDGSDGKEGKEIVVMAFTNQDSVELFLNGASLGSQKVAKHGHVEWKVKYAPGTIEARAAKDGRPTLTAKRETVGPPAKIVAVADRAAIHADGEDVSMINVSIVDAKGRVVPLAGNMLSFKLAGGGKLIGVGNGDPSCHEADKPANPAEAQRSAFNGFAQAIVLAPKQPGDMAVQVSSPGLEGATVKITAAPAKLRATVA